MFITTINIAALDYSCADNLSLIVLNELKFVFRFVDHSNALTAP